MVRNSSNNNGNNNNIDYIHGNTKYRGYRCPQRDGSSSSETLASKVAQFGMNWN